MKTKTFIYSALIGLFLIAAYSCNFFEKQPDNKTESAAELTNYIKKTDLKKENLKGNVSRIEQKDIWAKGIENRTWTYNKQGMLLWTDWDGKDSVICEYNDKGLLAKRAIRIADRGEDESSGSIYFEGKSFSNSIDQTFTYDDEGKLIDCFSGDTKTSYIYNDKGLLMKKKNDSNFVISYLYDENENLKIEYIGEDPKEYIYFKEYDKNGKVVFEMNTDAHVHFEYNDNGDESCITFFTEWEGEGTTLLFEYEEYDQNGNWVIRKRTTPNGELDNVIIRKIEYYE